MTQKMRNSNLNFREIFAYIINYYDCYILLVYGDTLRLFSNNISMEILYGYFRIILVWRYFTSIFE